MIETRDNFSNIFKRNALSPLNIIHLAIDVLGFLSLLTLSFQCVLSILLTFFLIFIELF